MLVAPRLDIANAMETIMDLLTFDLAFSRRVVLISLFSGCGDVETVVF